MVQAPHQSEAPGRRARFCSATCRQLAYARRKLQKEKQAEADAINAANFPAWATHLHVKPKLSPRRRPRRLQCPVCKFPYVIKKRGPIPKTCSTRCAGRWPCFELMAAASTSHSSC
jgi:hypothetical protein